MFPVLYLARDLTFFPFQRSLRVHCLQPFWNLVISTSPKSTITKLKIKINTPKRK